jgi:hypothetical protein
VAALPRIVPLCAALIYALALAPAARADSVPASIRACTLETDSLKRLVCFDRELARYRDQPSTGDAKQVPSAAAAAPVGAAAAGAATAAPAAPDPPVAPAKPRHTAARIVGIENFPDALVLHLDNGQVWEQIQVASADVNLHQGDTVTIDREMGSFWLSGGNGAAMKVKQKN